MPVTKITRRHQVTIPKDIFDQLALEEGDFLDVQSHNNAIVMVPKKLIPKDQGWFWTREHQEKEREANADLAAGRVYGPYETAEHAVAALRDKRKRVRKA